MIPSYDHIWRATRRVCEVLASESRGVAVELAAILDDAEDADALDELRLVAPTVFEPFDREVELAEFAVNADCWCGVMPSGQVARSLMLGDLETRTEEIVWRLVVGVRLPIEAGNTRLSESWADVSSDARERRRLAVVLGAITNVVCRDARDGVNILTSAAAGLPEHGVQVLGKDTARWGRQSFDVTQFVEFPNYAVG